MIGQCKVMPMASDRGAICGAVDTIAICTGHRRLIPTTAAMVSPDRGDFTAMKGERKGFCRARPNGNMRPDPKAAAIPHCSGVSQMPAIAASVQ